MTWGGKFTIVALVAILLAGAVPYLLPPAPPRPPQTYLDALATAASAAASRRGGGLTALTLGSSGSVGTQLVRALVAHPSFDRVVVVTRRLVDDLDALGDATTAVEQHVVDYGDLRAGTAAVVASLPGAPRLVAFNTIGIGHGSAKITATEHRAVDVEMPRAFVQGIIDATESGNAGALLQVVHMTAIGADATASDEGHGGAGGSRYNRVKGDAEEAVKAVCAGTDVRVTITRPSVIFGIPATPSFLTYVWPPLSKLLMGDAYKGIDVEMLAGSMAAQGASDLDTKGTPLHYYEMEALHKAVFGAAAA